MVKLSVILSILLAVLFSTTSTLAHSQKVYSQRTMPSSADIDQYILEQIANKNVVGMSVAVVQDNEIIYLKGFGTASVKNQNPVTPQTIFDLASCSKSFTAMATLLLWNDGKIDLDQSLQYYIPEFQLKDTEISSQITVRQLLNQTSGLPGNVSEPMAFHNTTEELIAAMKKVNIDSSPGSEFGYSNMNYCLLGALVERVSSKTFEDFMQERVFMPLGMVNSTLKPEVAEKLDRADGHQLMLGKIVVRHTPIYHSVAPAGWVMSSSEDMSKWLQLNINGGRLNNQQIIPENVIQIMQKPGVNLIKDGEKASYGMGWFIDEINDSETVIWHGGDTTDFLSEMIILPDRKLGLVMLVNSQTSRDAHSIAIGIASLLIGAELKLPASPWWASWAEIDHIALIAVIMAVVLTLSLIPYLWWQSRIIRRYRKREKVPPYTKKTMKILSFVFPVTPWVILSVVATVAYIVMQTLFGFDIFLIIVRFGMFAPPGVLIAAAAIMASILLWMLALTITGYIRVTARAKAYPKP